VGGGEGRRRERGRRRKGRVDGFLSRMQLGVPLKPFIFTLSLIPGR
jgi:membrane carboxypeptidase/penicillin-binding protein PbpC